MGWAGDAISGCQFFLQKKRYLPAAWNCALVPSLPGPMVFALIATALAWSSTDAALLMAVGCGVFLRTMEALTLQRHQITAHSSCILLTLPITKTSERTGEAQSVIVDVLLLISITRDYLLQWSAHSFRTIFATLLNALGLTSFQFTPCNLRRGGATAQRVLHRNMEWTQPLRRVAGPQ